MHKSCGRISFGTRKIVFPCSDRPQIAWGGRFHFVRILQLNRNPVYPHLPDYPINCNYNVKTGGDFGANG